MRTLTIKLSIIGIGLIILNLAFTAVSDAQLTGRKFLEAAVAMWTFEEAARVGIPDITGNGHDAKLINKPVLVDGKFGKAIEFSDTRKNYLEVPDDVDLNLEDVISISVWVKRPPRLQATDVAPYFILHRGAEWQWQDPGYGIALHKVFDNMFYFWYQNGFQGASGIKDDEWHHYVAVAKDGERAPTLYIDGESKPVEHSDGAKKMILAPPLGQPIYIGALLPARFDSFSKSIIDELVIFNVALSEADVKQLGKGLDKAIFAVAPSGKLATSWAAIKSSH
jgi:hypothetical protein